MKLSKEKVHRLCAARGTTVTELLRLSGVSRNAFYTLSRKKTVLPRSVRAIAERLGVDAGKIMVDETKRLLHETRRLNDEVRRIVGLNGDADPENVRHTLLLLQEPPLDRLRRAIRRARGFAILE